MRCTTIPAGLLLTLSLTGCGSAVKLTDSTDPMCPRFDQVTLQYGDAQLALDRECIEVDGGTTVTLNLPPAVSREAGKVRTKYKGLFNRWLDKSNAAGDTMIMLIAPDDGDPDKVQYKYEIHVKGVGVLDPRIVVQ